MNWLPMALSPTLLSLLRYTYEFDGLIISDYDEISKIAKQTIPTSFQHMDGNDSVTSIMNAGIDMIMLSG